MQRPPLYDAENVILLLGTLEIADSSFVPQGFFGQPLAVVSKSHVIMRFYHVSRDARCVVTTTLPAKLSPKKKIPFLFRVLFLCFLASQAAGVYPFFTNFQNSVLLTVALFSYWSFFSALCVNLYNAKSPLSLVERSIFGRVADLTL